MPGRSAAERLEQRLSLLLRQAGAGVDDVDAKLGGSRFGPEEHK